MRKAFASLVALAWVATPLSISAQRRWPVSFEANAGFASGFASTEYRGNIIGLSADALLAVRIQRLGSGSGVVAATAGAQTGGSGTDICILKPDGTCIPSWPLFQVFSLLAGWETSSTSLRVLAGPAYVRVDYDPAPFALVARLDVASPIFPHFSFATSLRAVTIPSYNDETFVLFALGFGFRIR